MWRRRPELPLDRETVDADAIILKLMDIDRKLEVVMEYLGLEDDGEEEDDS